jgi:hypothetical protein
MVKAAPCGGDIRRRRWCLGCQGCCATRQHHVQKAFRYCTSTPICRCLSAVSTLQCAATRDSCFVHLLSGSGHQRAGSCMEVVIYGRVTIWSLAGLAWVGAKPASRRWMERGFVGYCLYINGKRTSVPLRCVSPRCSDT